MGVTSKYCEVSVLLQPWKCKPYQVIRDEDFIFKHKKQNKPPSAPLPLSLDQWSTTFLVLMV